jgi:hypothetical protein
MLFGKIGGGVAAMAVEDGEECVVQVDGSGDVGVFHVFAETLHPGDTGDDAVIRHKSGGDLFGHGSHQLVSHGIIIFIIL